MKAIFFTSGAEFRRWLQEHSADSAEVWVGYFKAGSGDSRLTWPESVDHALCYGWIDGLRKSIDDARYMIRFTPRKPTSTWSAVNIKRVRALMKRGLIQPSGVAAFQARREARSRIYSYEQRPTTLPARYRSILEKNAAAFDFFSTQPASYRRAAIWWVASAKQEETRQRRLQRLMADSASGRRLKQFT